MELEFQFRPIFAAYCTPFYKVAKFIVSLLSELPKNEYSVKNSSSFVSELLSNNFQADNLYMTSYDVENLYTNVPLRETINIIVNKIFINADSSFIGLSKSCFTKLLEIATTNCFFLFNGQLYKQCDGLGMGLPQSPIFADIFLSFHEEMWLSNCPIEFKPIFYRRYVDDTFILFSDKSHAPKFLNYINRQHDNINFTMETERANSLSFLDVLVSRQNNEFVTSVFRKSSFSGLGISFFSFCTKQFKTNAVLTLINRAYKICSNYFLLHDEFQFLTTFFQNNGFPRQLFQSKIKSLLNKRFQNVTTNNPDKEQLYFSFPYFGHQSEKLKIELIRLLNHYFSQFSHNVILVNNFTIGSLFRHKDTLNKGMRSAVVYKFSCPECGVQYVGSTTRSLATRTAEHAGVSVRTGRPLSQPPQSHIRDHLLSCNGPQVNLKHIDIIGTCQNKTELRILESLHILQSKPTLNCMQSAHPLNIIK